MDEEYKQQRNVRNKYMLCILYRWQSPSWTTSIIVMRDWLSHHSCILNIFKLILNWFLYTHRRTDTPPPCVKYYIIYWCEDFFYHHHIFFLFVAPLSLFFSIGFYLPLSGCVLFLIKIMWCCDRSTCMQMSSMLVCMHYMEFVKDDGTSVMSAVRTMRFMW